MKGEFIMKYVCSVCGYVHEGDQAPEKCPQCGVPAEKFTAQSGERQWAAEHVVGVAQGAPEDIMEDLITWESVQKLVCTLLWLE